MSSFSRSRPRRLRVWCPAIKNAHINTPEAGELYYPAPMVVNAAVQPGAIRMRINDAGVGIKLVAVAYYHHEICHPEIKRLLPREVSCRCFYSLAAGRAVAGEERKRRDTAGDTGIARC